jgi:hypothetical protein
MPTRTKCQLEELIQRIDAADPCEKHGREELCVCIECGETVQCGECHPIPCQCWNEDLGYSLA